MNEEQKNVEKKKKSIGSVRQQSQYATFGNPEVQTSTSPEVHPVEVQVSPGSEVQTSKVPQVKRSKHPDWVQQTIYLPPRVRKWLRVFAAQQEVEVSEIVNLALKEYQKQYERESY